MSIIRTFARRPEYAGLPGLREGAEVVDVTRFGEPQTVAFQAEGEPVIDDFVLGRAAWERLGEPERITVTVEAV